jgi:hypothetical protein
LKLTYYVPTTSQDQAELLATIARLFPGTAPAVTQRATGTSNIDWQNLDALADLLNAQVVYTPYIVFTLDPAPDPASYSAEQVALLNGPGVEVKRDIDPQELLKQIEDEEK